jgi:hypothetical protein
LSMQSFTFFFFVLRLSLNKAIVEMQPSQNV